MEETLEGKEECERSGVEEPAQVICLGFEADSYLGLPKSLGFSFLALPLADFDGTGVSESESSLYCAWLLALVDFDRVKISVVVRLKV